MPEAYPFWSLPIFKPKKCSFCLIHFEVFFFCKCMAKGRPGGQTGGGGGGGLRGPDLYVLLQPLLLVLQLAAALLLLPHAGLQLRHHQLQLLLAGCQPPPGLLGLSAQLCFCSELLCQAGALLFQLGVGWEVRGQQAAPPGRPSVEHQVPPVP